MSYYSSRPFGSSKVFRPKNFEEEDGDFSNDYDDDDDESGEANCAKGTIPFDFSITGVDNDTLSIELRAKSCIKKFKGFIIQGRPVTLYTVYYKLDT